MTSLVLRSRPAPPRGRGLHGPGTPGSRTPGPASRTGGEGWRPWRPSPRNRPRRKWALLRGGFPRGDGGWGPLLALAGLRLPRPGRRLPAEGGSPSGARLLAQAGAGPGAGVPSAVWAISAHRSAQKGHRPWAAFQLFASAAVAYPLLWETTVRLKSVSPGVASAAMLVWTLGLGVVAARHGLRRMAWIALLGSMATGYAIMAASSAVMEFSPFFILASGATLVLADRGEWGRLRWAAALGVDFTLLTMEPAGAVPGRLQRPSLGTRARAWWCRAGLAFVVTQSRRLPLPHPGQAPGRGGLRGPPDRGGAGGGPPGRRARGPGHGCYPGAGGRRRAAPGPGLLRRRLRVRREAHRGQPGFQVPHHRRPPPGALGRLPGAGPGGAGADLPGGGRRGDPPGGALRQVLPAVPRVSRSSWGRRRSRASCRGPSRPSWIRPPPAWASSRLRPGWPSPSWRPPTPIPWTAAEPSASPGPCAFPPSVFAALALAGLGGLVAASLAPRSPRDPGFLAVLRTAVLVALAVLAAAVPRWKPASELGWLAYPVLGCCALKLVLEDLPKRARRPPCSWRSRFSARGCWPCRNSWPGRGREASS